ncbi:hypothetical protein Vafri_20239, partial [Volvox africanus]
ALVMRQRKRLLFCCILLVLLFILGGMSYVALLNCQHQKFGAAKVWDSAVTAVLSSPVDTMMGGAASAAEPGRSSAAVDNTVHSDDGVITSQGCISTQQQQHRASGSTTAGSHNTTTANNMTCKGYLPRHMNEQQHWIHSRCCKGAHSRYLPALAS